MGLKREILSIPILGGLDTKTDAKLVVPGNLVICENAEFTKGRSLRKRAGHFATPCQTVDGTPITDALGLAALGDGWVLLGRRSAYVHDATRNAWSTLGAYTPVTWRGQEIARVSAQQTNPDLDSVGGVTATAWEDSRGGVFFQVTDDASGAALIGPLQASANASKPKVTRAGSNLLVTWHNSSTTAIECRVVQASDVAAAATAANVTLTANANASAQYDIVSGDGAAYLVFRQDAAVADTIMLFQVNPAGTVTRTATAHAVVADQGPAVCWDSATNAVYTSAYVNGTTTVHLAKFNGSNLNVEETQSFNPGALQNGQGLAPNSSGGVSIWYQLSGSGATRAVEIRRYSSALDLVGSAVTIRRTVLGTSPWWDGFNCLSLVSYAGVDVTGLQGGYYIVRDDGVKIGRVIYGSGHDGDTIKAHVKDLGDDQWVCALGFRRQVPVDINKVTGASIKFTPVYEHKGIQRVDLDCAPKLTPIEIDRVLYTNGGWLWAIDGAGAPVEAQIQQFPDMTTASFVSALGGNLTASSTYTYRWYYEWTLATGQRLRSLALTITVSTTGANFQFNITLPTLPYSQAQARGPVAIVGYRSAADNPTFLYRITSNDPSAGGANGFVANSTVSSTVSFTDNLSDANLVNREIDYMSQGEVVHVAFDGPAVIGEAGNRLWCTGGGENPDRPQYSLLRQDGAAIEANDVFVVSEFPEDGGRTVAISQLNGVPLVFKERAVYAIEGLGRLSNNADPDPYRVRRISSDVGCIDARSVLATSDGNYFQSAKGIYLLPQDLVPKYIGAAVEKYNNQDVTGAAVVPDTNQCVFLTSAGLSLMYDYFFQRWSTYTNHEGVSLAASRSGFAYLRNDGELFIRDGRPYSERIFTDAGVPIVTRGRIAPLHLEDTIQGLYLARKVMLIGEYVSPHELELRVFRNRELWPNQIITWKPNEKMGFTVWGDSTPWGSGTLWGGGPRNNEYSFERKLKARKVSTIAFEFLDKPGSPPGASFELTEIALEVWLEPGLARMPVSRKN